ncbi:MAG TPA: hypothetical protein VLJ14_02465 [Ktedonobacterales bacterium]|jgi:hypothetical protein|nr:hypothetical protein [Ktedonobacterales bacterium]
MAQMGVYPVPSCRECGLESAGRCTVCRRSLCIDHFGFEDHNPCVARLARHAAETICYVCGVPVRPQQWSTSVFAHYIDAGACAGCGRYICAERHTRQRDERVELVRDHLRSHRYHHVTRYCSVCAPLRGLGGLRGAGRWAALLSAAGALAFLIATKAL